MQQANTTAVNSNACNQCLGGGCRHGNLRVQGNLQLIQQAHILAIIIQDI